MGKKARARAEAQLAAVGRTASAYLAGTLPDISDSLGSGGTNWATPSSDLRYNPADTLGATGTSFFGGILSGEEYNPDLSGDALYRTVDRMWRSSAQVSALIAVQMLPLTQVNKWVAPASDAPKDVKVAQFVQDNLFGGLQRPFQQVDEESTLAQLRDGVSVLEKVYAKPDPNDGLIRLRKLAARPAKTIRYWFPNDDDDLDRIVQLVWVPDETGLSGQYKQTDPIPASKLVRFTNMQEANNFLGISVLRAAYKPWFILDQIERVVSVMIDRMGAGVPVFSEPQGPVQKSDRDNAANVLMSLHAHEKNYILEPYGWAFRFETTTGLNILPYLEYFSLQIVRSALAQFLNLDRGGSYALSLDISSFFLQALQSKLRYRLDVWDNDVIRPLVDMNFDVERYPTMQSDPLDKRDVDKFMAGLGAILPWLTKDAPTENAVRAMLDLPDLPPEATVAGGMSETVDTDSAGQGASNEAGTGDATTDETGQTQPEAAKLSALSAWLTAEVEALLAEPPSGLSVDVWREIVLSSAAMEAA